MPSRGVGGATCQSLPNATRAPASSSERTAYVSFARSAPDHALGPSPVVDGVIRLHAGNHAQRGEARNVRRREVLRMLDAKSPVTRSMLGDHALVDVELRPVCEISNRVDDEVQTSRIRALGPAIQIVDRIHEQTAIVWRVGEWLEHRRRVRAE